MRKGRGTQGREIDNHATCYDKAVLRRQAACVCPPHTSMRCPSQCAAFPAAIAHQTAITKDNVSISVDGVLYVRIVDPFKASYGVDLASYGGPGGSGYGPAVGLGLQSAIQVSSMPSCSWCMPCAQTQFSGVETALYAVSQLAQTTSRWCCVLPGSPQLLGCWSGERPRLL